MDINKLTYFFTAAEMENFTRAAVQCNIAQTTMSKYISMLEEETGCRLFVRTNKYCHLTEQGKTFYTAMKRIYHDYHQILQLINNSGGNEIRIGLKGDYISLPVLKDFEEDIPSIRLIFSFSDEESLFADLQRTGLDAVIVPYHLPDNDDSYESFRSVLLLEREELFVCSKKLFKEKGSIEQVVTSTPMITKSYDMKYHRYCHAKFEELFGNGFNEVKTVDSYSRQFLLLDHSNGFALLPETDLKNHQNLISFSLGDYFKDKYYLIYNTDNISENMKSLLKYISDHS